MYFALAFSVVCLTAAAAFALCEILSFFVMGIDFLSRVVCGK